MKRPGPHPIGDLLRQAAAALPATERLRFDRFLRGLEGRAPRDLVPGTPALPALTVNRPGQTPRARRGSPPAPNERPSWALSRPECGWYYGEPCGCGGPHQRGQARQIAVQLPLPFGPRR